MTRVATSGSRLATSGPRLAASGTRLPKGVAAQTVLLDRFDMSSSSWIDADGLHVYGAARNYAPNPDLVSADGITATGWGFYLGDRQTASLTSCIDGVQKMLVTAITGTPLAVDASTFYRVSAIPAGPAALSFEVKLDLTGNAVAPAGAYVTIYLDGVGGPYTLVTQADIGAGWKRIYLTKAATGAGCYINCGLHISDANWSGGTGGLQLSIRRPQVEPTIAPNGSPVSQPGVISTDPGAIIGATYIERAQGWASCGFSPSDGGMGASPFRLNTGQDWCCFIEFTPKTNLAEVVLNSTSWILATFDHHYDAPVSVHNEIHFDLNYNGAGGNSLMAGNWDSNGNGDVVNSAIDLNATIKAGTLCRMVYWKVGNVQSLTLKAGATTTVLINAVAARDLGILPQMTIGVDHKEVGNPKWLCSNSVFSHIAVEQAAITGTDATAYLTTGSRPQNPNTIMRWVVGSSVVYLKPPV